MFCKECGYQIMDGWKFCEGCGRPLEAVEKTKEPETKMEESMPVAEENGGGSVVNKIFGFTLLLIAFLAVLFYVWPEAGNLLSKDAFKKPEIFKSSKSYKIAKIVYEVTGTASSASVVITNAEGGTEMRDVKLPFKYGFPVSIKRSDYIGYYAHISAQNLNYKGSVIVTIYVNDRKFKTSTSNGSFVIAEADGLVTYENIE